MPKPVSQAPTILVVDDNHYNLQLLVRLLDQYQVQAALNGRLALQLAQTDPPDLVLLDVCMPTMDGYEVCRQLKADPDTAAIPVIFLSAMDTMEDKVKAFEVGGVDYIIKPFQTKEVQMRVQTQLTIRTAQQKIQALNATLEAQVKQRTAELEATHQQLLHESMERQQAQESVLKITQQLLQQRSDIIDQTYDAVHNGPLQELAVILRTIHSGQWQQSWLDTQLQKVNTDLRGIYQTMRNAARNHDEIFYLTDGQTIDLTLSTPEFLNQVFDYTMARDFPGFATIPIALVPDFTPLSHVPLTVQQRRCLGLFLQEALCNVGKHALGTTHINVICAHQDHHYSLQVIDNGPGNRMLPRSPQPGGRGTQQAKTIAKRLKGQFYRHPNQPQGIICELRWPDSLENS